MNEFDVKDLWINCLNSFPDDNRRENAALIKFVKELDKLAKGFPSFELALSNRVKKLGGTNMMLIRND